MTLAPNPNSIRSQKRESRGFIDLKTSSRKHRRANKRSIIACMINGQWYKPGSRVLDASPTKMSSFMQNAGGSLKYA